MIKLLLFPCPFNSRLIKMAFKINIIPQNITITAQQNELLVDKIQETGINLSVYCNKKGLCGKCLVEIVDGELPPLKEREEFLLEQKNLEKNYRLACLYKIKGDISIKIPEESILQEAFILKTGIRSSIPLDPAVKKYHLRLKKPEISSPSSLLEILKLHFKEKNLNILLDLLKDLGKTLERSKYHVTAVVHRNKEILSIEPLNTLGQNFGICFDIGTTTLVMELLDLNTGKTIDILTEMNSQVKYGADVISRIGYALSDRKNQYELRDSIIKTLNRMIVRLLKKNQIDPSFVYEIVAAGNTSMNHFLLGMPVNTLAAAPYSAVFSCLPELSSHTLGFKINKFGKIYIAPNIKSFVGGDISAGLVAVDLENKKGNFLFIDLGTNGEIVLKKGKKFIATSTAAGPAFEGMNISCGKLALPGAIYKAEYTDKLKTFTIENKPASGICGTGLIDLISIFLEKGEIFSKGTIQNNTKRIAVTSSIYITQKDVREIQLAVAAIKTGIKMILQENNVTLEEIDGIFIAGAFGNYLNIKNSKKIGLLPEIDEEKIIFIGNSSLAGARALLLSNQARKKIESLVKKIQFISLATKPSFQKYFINALEFK